MTIEPETRQKHLQEHKINSFPKERWLVLKAFKCQQIKNKQMIKKDLFSANATGAVWLKQTNCTSFTEKKRPF